MWNAVKRASMARALEAVYLGLTSNKSLWVFYLPEKNSLFTLNQAKFDEHVYQFRKASIIDKYLSDNSIDILYKHPDNISWVTYNSKHVANYKEVHHDKDSGVSTFQIMTAEKTYTREKKIRYHDDMIQNLIVRHNEETIQAHAALLKHRTLLGLDPEIDPDRPPKTFADAMSRKDSALWAAAFNKKTRD
jgi:hypothetical protein